MAERPIKLTIAALGGQGGGVLADWLIAAAEAEGYLAQSTSVPGVAQRTGATIYYLEFFPRALAERAGRDPVLALMPVSGDVDCVIASELAEAGRAIQRGLVTPDRTTLISSTHRSYVIAEKSAMGDGTADTPALLNLVRTQAKRLILFDMEATAERNGSVISSVLLGALCGSAVLPFRRETFIEVIQKSGIAVKANLAAFDDARQQAERGDNGYGGQSRRETASPVPQQARSPRLQGLLDRVRQLPLPVQPVVLEGVRRTIDYQDPAYAALYLQRLESIAAQEKRAAGAGASHALLESTARGLALWMTFEDPIRVADLKTRGSRFTRVREEVRATPGQLVGITEFVRPRVLEIAGTLPAGVGRWILRSPRISGRLARWTEGKQIRTTTVSGFVLLYVLAGLRRWRRRSLRFQEENGRIEDWLARIARYAESRYALALEVARAQRLVKGYGDTHERGWTNFTQLMEQLEWLAAREDGAQWMARLQVASLADEEGATLKRTLEELRATAGTGSQAQRVSA